MDQVDALHTRVAQYLAFPEDDVEGRRQLAPTEEDLDALHALMVRSREKRALYYQVTLAKRADQIFCNGGQAQGLTVAQIRQQLTHRETRTYEDQGESIREVVSFRFWPRVRHIDRERKQPNGGGIIIETEWDYLVPVDLEHEWQTLLQPGFDEETLLLAQRYVNHEWVKEIAFLPPDGITYRIIFKAGEEEKTFITSTALRYKPLLTELVKKYTLEESNQEFPGELSTPSSHNSVEMAEGHLGLLQAVKDYDPKKVRSVPGYVEQRLRWHFGDAFDHVSTETDRGLREPGQHRILKSRFERLGGEFDAPIGEEDGEQGDTTLRDKFKDPKPISIEDEILIREIAKTLLDPIDKQIFSEKLLGVTQQELAKKLGITQPAIAKRLKKIQEQVRKVLAE